MLVPNLKVAGPVSPGPYGCCAMFLILNERRYSELITAFLSQCQLFLLVYSVAVNPVIQPSADNVSTLALVTLIRPLLEITDVSSGVDGVEAQFSNSNRPK